MAEIIPPPKPPAPRPMVPVRLRPEDEGIALVQQARELAERTGVDPLLVLLAGAGGHLPRFEPYCVDGELRFQLLRDADTGAPVTEVVTDVFARAAMAKEAVGYLLPKLQRVHVSDEALRAAGRLKGDQPGNEGGAAPSTLLELLMRTLGPGDSVTVARTEEKEDDHG